jgi:hypothetical protein
MRSCILGLLLVFCLGGVPLAEEPSDRQVTLPSLEERQRRLEGLDLALPEAPDSQVLDPKSEEKYLLALRRYYDYRISGYDHRLRLFEWQFLSSKIIFVVVLFLVFSGIYFAAVQFHSGLSQSRKEKTTGSEEVTEFVLSLKGLKVRSQVLGVIILVISLAFFYLYLVYVYPIENVF